MYEEFYRFVQSPFTLTPDPRFLDRSEPHDDAINLLLQTLSSQPLLAPPEPRRPAAPREVPDE